MITEEFNREERESLAPHFTNTDRACFGLTNLPEVVKGALFARYSRSRNSLRRLFLSEFGGMDRVGPFGTAEPDAGETRATELYDRVLGAYGDDSVAQLGSAHIACEGVSNVLTKILERGRLMSYLEQSTRYIPYNEQVNGRWRYTTPAELDGALATSYKQVMDLCFETYHDTYREALAWLETNRPRKEHKPEAAYRRAIRAKALDTTRGLLPTATASNVGIHGSGQGFEALVLRLLGHELEEARTLGTAMLDELRKMIPAFVTRADRPDRGGRTIAHMQAARGMSRTIAQLLEKRSDRTEDVEVRLVDHNPHAEAKVVAALAYEESHADFAHLVGRMTDGDPGMTRGQISAMISSYADTRTNRRHKVGRGLEHAEYTFEITGDYGAFRDLQRHRMLTIQWQKLSPRHGFSTPTAILEMGSMNAWERAMDAAREIHERIEESEGPAVAQYAVPMAYRIRFLMRLNAREAAHMLELRTQPQGHPSYRWVCQRMHELIRDEARHTGIADLMKFVNHDDVDLERLAAEQKNAARLENKTAEPATATGV